MQYDNFDCLIDPIDPAGKTYKIRVLESPAGQAESKVQLPFEDRDLESLILKVSLSHVKRRSRRSAEIGETQTFGENLFKAFFRDEVANCLERSFDAIESKGTGLRLRLRLTNAPKLLELPWEYLYHPARMFFCLSDQTSLVRYLDIPQSITPLKVKLPLRALVMIAAPHDEPQLNLEQEWRNLNNAVATLKSRGLFEIDCLQTATLNALNERLREKDYHIFHFIGHGGFDRNTHAGKILFEDENQNGHTISGEALAGVLRNEKATLRLVILNACEGARTSCHDAFAGTAQKITQQGIPAVIAMQFAITDEAAVTFTKEFYGRLARGLSLDRTLAETRQALYGEEHKLEWATPVLYMRTPNGDIFDIEDQRQNSSQQTQTPPPLQDDFERAYKMQTLLSILYHLHELPQEARGLSITDLANVLGIQRRKFLVETLYEQVQTGLIEQLKIQGNTFWKISEAGRKLVSRLQESLGTRIQTVRK